MLDWHIKSYIVIVPVFAAICIAIQFGIAAEKVNTALLGGLALVMMLSIDLWHTTNKLRQLALKIKELETEQKNT